MAWDVLVKGRFFLTKLGAHSNRWVYGHGRGLRDLVEVIVFPPCLRPELGFGHLRVFVLKFGEMGVKPLPKPFPMLVSSVYGPCVSEGTEVLTHYN